MDVSDILLMGFLTRKRENIQAVGGLEDFCIYWRDLFFGKFDSVKSGEIGSGEINENSVLCIMSVKI